MNLARALADRLVAGPLRWQSGVVASRISMSRPNAGSLPNLSVRIDLDTESRIGPGKIQLLENIHKFGSISAAGRAMDMSYKRAWDLVDEINRVCRQAAVERRSGADAVRPVVGGALPENRARRRNRRAQGAGRAAQRHRAGQVTGLAKK